MSESSLCRVVGASAVGGLGLVVAGVWTLRIETRLSHPLAGGVAPLGFTVLLFVAAGWLLRSDLDGRVALRVPLSTFLGMIGFGGFALLAVASVVSVPGVQSTLVLLNFVSAGGAAGVVVGLFTATQTSTIRELRERETALRQVRDEYRTLFDGVGDAVLVHDTRGEILAANDAAHTRFGYDAEAITERAITDLEDAPRRVPHATSDAGHLWTHADRFGYAAVHVAADGETVPVEVSASVVRYRGDVAVLLVGRDVTRRRAAERDLAHTQDRLQSLNRVLRHDIRNDMQIVVGTARLLEDHVDDAGRDYLQTILSTAEHVVELTRSSRDLERTVTGGSEFPLEPVSLAETLETELDRGREVFDHATLRADGDLPDVDVRANELLSSVFRNLVNNAVQHCDHDEPTVVVSADHLREDRRVRVRVADDGPGIPDDVRGSLFGEGEKGVASDGTGLGLSLVQSLVDHYDGDVWVEDNDPCGAVVTVELPVAGTDA